MISKFWIILVIFSLRKNLFLINIINSLRVKNDYEGISNTQNKEKSYKLGIIKFKKRGNNFISLEFSSIPQLYCTPTCLLSDPMTCRKCNSDRSKFEPNNPPQFQMVIAFYLLRFLSDFADFLAHDL